MSQLYQNNDIRFEYPDGWELDESRTEDELTLSLESPEATFLFLKLYDSLVPPDTLADQALRTMQEEYPESDATPISEVIADCPAVGHDVNFFSLDLTNTCWIRAFSSSRHTVLLFAQTSDLELESSGRAFQEICASIELSDVTNARLA